MVVLHFARLGKILFSTARGLASFKEVLMKFPLLTPVTEDSIFKTGLTNISLWPMKIISKLFYQVTFWSFVD